MSEIITNAVQRLNEWAGAFYILRSSEKASTCADAMLRDPNKKWGDIDIMAPANAESAADCALYHLADVLHDCEKVGWPTPMLSDAVERAELALIQYQKAMNDVWAMIVEYGVPAITDRGIDPNAPRSEGVRQDLPVGAEVVSGWKAVTP